MRRRMNSKKDKKIFKRTAARVSKTTLGRKYDRGGTRL